MWRRDLEGEILYVKWMRDAYGCMRDEKSDLGKAFGWRNPTNYMDVGCWLANRN